MAGKLVVKRLSASDLTLFKWHFDRTSGTKQKAINLDVDPFVTELYPSLPDAAAERPRGVVPLELSIHGPGLAGQHNVARKILKQQKNWRLNGEYIPDPDDQLGRYAELQKGDYAIFDFYGNIIPQSIRIYLISRGNPDDAGLHAAICAAVEDRLSHHKSMLVLNTGAVERILRNVPVNSEHPVLDLLEETDLEDAAFGGALSVQRLVDRRAGRPVTYDELQRARKNAERIGRLGEELVNMYLGHQHARGDLSDYRWDTDENAVLPYDFSVTVGEQKRLLDVKSTSGLFNSRFHVSTAELLMMKDAEIPYDLYRLYDVSESSAKCRIAYDVKSMAIGILQVLNTLPAGVVVDSVAASPGIWNFSEDEIHISSSEEEGGKRD